MPIYIDSIIAQCFHCRAEQRIQRAPMLDQNTPPLPPKWGFFQRAGDDWEKKPQQEVFCPKHFPKEGWRQVKP